MKNIDETNYEKEVKKYGYFASLPIIAAILHLVAMVWMMSTCVYHTDLGNFSTIYTLGELYSLSSFATLLTSNMKDAQLVNTVTGIVSIVLALGMIFLSASAVKGKKFAFKIAACIYFFDTLMMIPTLIINFVPGFLIRFSIVDIILMILIHVVITGFFIYGWILCHRLDEYEEHISIMENQIHITKGANYKEFK